MSDAELDSSRLGVFVRTAQNNLFATAQGFPDQVWVLTELCEVMGDIVETVVEPINGRQSMTVRDLAAFGAFAYLNAARMAMEGQSSAVPVNARAALEAILYSARCRENKEAADLWHLRHAEFLEFAVAEITAGRKPDISKLTELDSSQRRQVSSTFSIEVCARSVLALHKNDDRAEERVASLRRYYQLLIDLGGHPNLLQVLMSTSRRDGKNLPPGTAIRELNLMHRNTARIVDELNFIADIGAVLVSVLMVILPQEAIAVDASRRLAIAGALKQKARANRAKDNTSPRSSDQGTTGSPDPTLG